MARVVIAYDISEDGRRTRVAKLLEDLMPRVQKSVFEGSMPETELRRAVSRARKQLKPGDGLRVYRLCAVCSGRTEAFGGAAVVEPAPVRVL